VPFAIRLHPEHRLAVVTFSGVVDEAEAFVATGELALQRAQAPQLDVVWDGRAVERVDAAAEARVAAVGGPLDEYLGEGRSAALLRPGADAETTLLLGGLGWGHPGREVRTFDDAARAAAWLGVPADLLGVPQAA
jgi:hypothetical protein